MAYFIRKSEPESIETESTMPVGGLKGLGEEGMGKTGSQPSKRKKSGKWTVLKVTRQWEST